jgi:hypothetical protein
MRYLHKEPNGDEIFALESGDLEKLFPLYAKKLLYFSGNSGGINEAFQAQMELNQIAREAYLKYLAENEEGVDSDYESMLYDEENVVEVIIQRPRAGFPGTASRKG